MLIVGLGVSQKLPATLVYVCETCGNSAAHHPPDCPDQARAAVPTSTMTVRREARRPFSPGVPNMPETRRAVVVVDVQQEYFSGPLAIEFPPVERSLANILAVLDVAAGEGIPVAVVRHEKPEGAALFAAGSPGWEFHPSLEARLDPAWKRITKSFASCFDHTDLAEWLSGHDVNTVTLVGYMTNNCILATAAAATTLGLGAEVLSDATGSPHLANAAGTVPARRLHEDLMVLLHSNWAAVATTAEWVVAATTGSALPKSNLLASARQAAPVLP